MFSTRTPSDLGPNRLSQLIEEKRRAGARLCDLTASNPTVVDLKYPQTEVNAALAVAGAGVYQPEPRGLDSARAAVAGYFAQRSIAVSRDNLLLTSTTSEAYAYLFKLLCAPGDHVLFPRPSYPLFEHLAQVEAVEARYYDLDASRGFGLDVDRVEAALSDRTRAVVVVSPNNPTGTMVDRASLEELAELVARHDIALIGDEVFADYTFVSARPPSVLDVPGGLRFSLGGLSKACGLPQLKLSWIAMDGPKQTLPGARARLELIADTFLSVASPIQRALPEILQIGKTIRASIRARIAEGLAIVRQHIAKCPGAALCEPAGGWYAPLSLPPGFDDEALCVHLLAEHDVLIHPGYLFDMPAGHVVVCLLSRPSDMVRGLRALNRVIASARPTS